MCVPVEGVCLQSPEAVMEPLGLEFQVTELPDNGLNSYPCAFRP